MLEGRLAGEGQRTPPTQTTGEHSLISGYSIYIALEILNSSSLNTDEGFLR